MKRLLIGASVLLCVMVLLDAALYTYDRHRKLTHNVECERTMQKYATTPDPNGRVLSNGMILPSCVYEIVPPTWSTKVSNFVLGTPMAPPMPTGCDQSATTTDCSNIPPTPQQEPQFDTSGYHNVIGDDNLVYFNDHKANSNNITDDDQILIYKGNATYQINIATRDLQPYSTFRSKVASFTGLPKETRNKEIGVFMTRVLLSQDKTKAIVTFTTFDETKAPSAFDGSLPAIKADEFICDIAAQRCSATDILARAYKASGLASTWFEYPMVWWVAWDSTKNILYGHLSGEGVGNSSPVYALHADTGLLQQTVGYDWLNKKEKRAEVPMGAFSPSLDQFVMIEAGTDAWSMLLYESNNFSRPLKRYDISSMIDKTNGASRIGSVAWSGDEQTIVVETDRKIFLLNTVSGKISLLYTDTTADSSGLWLDFNAIYFSTSGRYVVFVDYDKRNTPFEDNNNKLNTVLKAIDLGDRNKVIELLREEYLNLYIGDY